ncbi:MAG: Minor allergen Alt a 7 [Piccolia ochrophora]|nr:MAG: Minor allergen Alt a 7 [Piccolia ochrophora]
MAPKVAIVYYSMYGHILQLAEAEKAGVESAGGTAQIFQFVPKASHRGVGDLERRAPLNLNRVPETLPEDALKNLGAAPKADHPVIDQAKLEEFDAVLFGVPTRYGNMPAQWKAFWDHTGKQWATGGYWNKYAGLFVSTASLGGGQESTAIACMSTLAHHGWNYVPLGYKTTFAMLTNLEEVHGGSPWGAGTFSAGDGSRQPTPLEIDIAKEQGKSFYERVSKVNFD